jgi:hypothetical protein
MRTSIALTCLALVLPFAACGGNGSSQDEEQIRAAITQHLSALAAKDYAKACSYTTDALKKQVAAETKTDSCEQGWESLITQLPPEKIDELRKAEVTRIQINGDTAEADGAPAALFSGGQLMQKVDGKWLLDKS